ncbi:hypothetical protein BT63DRAFT_456995 [Microthyrium microscopicum]|uniref:Large ribosomal subunit protein uL23m n=1 Tax=Microthyrium microscopicum TaxID=703497 RepID=A0A6A6U5Y4_9PEZI|nr:hypothetical protein BT63DRAFT_456995 [Microthyrium microscopicum]
MVQARKAVLGFTERLRQLKAQEETKSKPTTSDENTGLDIQNKAIKESTDELRVKTQSRENEDVDSQNAAMEPPDDANAEEAAHEITKQALPSNMARPVLLARAKEEGVAHFPVGHKEIHLPDVKVILLRTPELHPRFAKFEVPLTFTKLDLRDFLWHGYQVRALNVRSWVFQRPVQLLRPGLDKKLGIQGDHNKWGRKQALKYMIIEMDEPFIWPEMPEDMTLFDKEHADDRMVQPKWTDDGKVDWVRGSNAIQGLKEKREDLAEQAQKLLSGRARRNPNLARQIPLLKYSEYTHLHRKLDQTALD